MRNSSATSWNCGLGLRPVVALVLIVFLWPTQKAEGQAAPVASPSPTECDSLAGHGNYISKDEARNAVRTCADEVAKNPSVARFSYQLGRALDQLSQYRQARAAFEAAAKLGHGQAMFKLYRYYKD